MSDAELEAPKHVSAHSPRRRWGLLRFRLSLKSGLTLILICALLVGWARERNRAQRTKELATVKIEVYTDRDAFLKRLGGQVRHVDFDDIDTRKSDSTSFSSTRFESKGIHIAGSGGQQFAGRTFGFPKQYPPASRPNSYAPGPKGKNPGGNRTDVTFVMAGGKALTAGFGITFIDVDYPGLGDSSLTAYGWADHSIGSATGFRGADGGQIFRGLIAVDSNGNPIPAISRVQVINGTGWPGIDAGDGVTLDDIVFGIPQHYGP